MPKKYHNYIKLRNINDGKGVTEKEIKLIQIGSFLLAEHNGYNSFSLRKNPDGTYERSSQYSSGYNYYCFNSPSLYNRNMIIRILRDKREMNKKPFMFMFCKFKGVEFEFYVEKKDSRLILTTKPYNDDFYYVTMDVTGIFQATQNSKKYGIGSGKSLARTTSRLIHKMRDTALDMIERNGKDVIMTKFRNKKGAKRWIEDIDKGLNIVNFGTDIYTVSKRIRFRKHEGEKRIKAILAERSRKYQEHIKKMRAVRELQKKYPERYPHTTAQVVKMLMRSPELLAQISQVVEQKSKQKNEKMIA